MFGGLGMTLLVYQVFMKENPDGSGGITERAGYFGYSLFASTVIFFVILISTTGTFKQIPYLRQPRSAKSRLGRWRGRSPAPSTTTLSWWLRWPGCSSPSPLG
uniref:Uncharacterized protein n=1 Tax=Phenylobacterium glaciei TaxID=2803784 RepID=A0A974P3V0_9CAUL|nr:hypothetical protein JKL49_00170 [Phenylobacterium glaciei]